MRVHVCVDSGDEFQEGRRQCVPVSPFCSVPLLFLIVSLEAQRFLFLIESNLFSCLACVESAVPWSNLRTERFCSCFPQRASQFPLRIDSVLGVR